MANQQILPSLAVALGTFDGVHLGHQLIIKTLKNKANQLGIPTAVFTFDRHPLQVLRPKQSPLIITTPEEKAGYFRKLGVDFLIFAVFTPALAKLSSVSFVEEVLVKKLNIRLIVVGEDFTFGHLGAGNVETLKKYGNIYGFEVVVVPRYNHENRNTSSTEIRRKILSGLIEEANFLLGHPYEIKGKVTHGQKVGRKLGFPTANFYSEGSKVIPSDGVYVVQVEYENARYYGVANIGYRPTFFGDKRNIEVHIFDFDNNIYEKEITVGFLKKIRDEISFSSPEQLAGQIKKDVAQAKEWLHSQLLMQQ